MPMLYWTLSLGYVQKDEAKSSVNEEASCPITWANAGVKQVYVLQKAD